MTAVGTRGFTFLEIMICISIIAIVFTGVFQLQAANISLADSMRFKMTAASLAQNRLTQVILVGRVESESDGVFDEPFSDFSWKCVIGSYEPTDADLLTDKRVKRLKLVTMTVSRGSREFTLSTWRYFPDET